MVIRGLLESAGIASPPPTSTDPFPLREPPMGTHGVEILVLASQADDARSIIADYRDSKRGRVLGEAPSDKPSDN